MQIFAAAILFLSILLSGCATTYPESGEDQATYYTSEALAAIGKGDCAYAATQIDSALYQPTGNMKIKKLFTSNPKSQDCYYSYLEKKIVNVSDALQATGAFEKLSVVKSAGVFSENLESNLFEKLGKQVTEGNISGSVPFALGDKIDNFPELKSPLHQEIIINRSIINLQGTGTRTRPVSALMKYVQQVGVDSVEGKRIESLFPTLNIRRGEIDVVATVFPRFAATRKEEITARFFLQVKNADRILADDIRQMLRERVPGIEWVSSIGPKTTTLVIERVRNDEKILPERSQTITYAQYEVDTMTALLLMPRDASFLYEIVSGGAEIEYGYVVTVITSCCTVYEDVVRGKVGGEYSRCQNSRIQNVFGGVSSANFVANNDMQRRCAGPNSISIENLRRDVFSKVIGSVLQAPPIMAALDLN